MCSVKVYRQQRDRRCSVKQTGGEKPIMAVSGGISLSFLSLRPPLRIVCLSDLEAQHLVAHHRVRIDHLRRRLDTGSRNPILESLARPGRLAVRQGIREGQVFREEA